jgi:hypothetical protein
MDPLDTERAYCRVVKDWLETILNPRFATCHLEITADRHFSNVLQAQIGRSREIIFSFLRDAAPDITGFLKKDSSSLLEFVVVEVKRGPIRLDHVYQLRKYAGLFDARYALLVSPAEIPEKIMRLSQIVHSLLALPAYRQMTLIRLPEDVSSSEWVPVDPFR